MEMFIHVRCIPQQNSQWQFWASVWLLLLFLWTFEHVYIMRRPQKSLSSSKTNVNTLGMSQMIRSLSGWGWLRLVMYRQQESTKHINHKLLNLHLESFQDKCWILKVCWGQAGMSQGLCKMGHLFSSQGRNHAKSAGPRLQHHTWNIRRLEFRWGVFWIFKLFLLSSSKEV